MMMVVVYGFVGRCGEGSMFGGVRWRWWGGGIWLVGREGGGGGDICGWGVGGGMDGWVNRWVDGWMDVWRDSG